MNPQIFASLVQQAQELHDNSWNGKAHQLTHYNAAELICKRQQWDVAWAQPIALLNATAWNDIGNWAMALNS